MIGEVWELRRGDEVLAAITITQADFPWLSGAFCACPGFADVAPLFAEELALSTVLEDDDSPGTVAAWDALQARISATAELVAPAGPVAAYLLHVDADAGEAWLRWSDEPLAQT